VTERGLFITFEGGEGSGKSTQLQALAARVRGYGIEPVVCREPGGTAFGERLRPALLDSESPVSPYAELLVFAAARAQLVGEVIRPALEMGALVLCDRFADSTVAYQRYGRGLDAGLVASINAAATQGLAPDLTILLDIPPIEGLARAGAEHDYIEREALEFHERVRAGYRALAAADPARWLVLDATRPEAELTDLAWGRIAALLDARDR